MDVVVVGAGYVGLSLALLLAKRNNVNLVDIVPDKVRMINERRSPICDKELEERLKEPDLKLIAVCDGRGLYSTADYVVIATPTDYDDGTGCFNTTSVESVVRQVLRENKNACIVIKSTVPIGFTEELQHKLASKNILFSPEFLREGRALYDILYPSRIIVGVNDTGGQQIIQAQRFIKLS